MVVSAVELTCYYFTFFILMPLRVQANTLRSDPLSDPNSKPNYLSSAHLNDERYVNLSFLLYIALGLIVVSEFIDVAKELTSAKRNEQQSSADSGAVLSEDRAETLG